MSGTTGDKRGLTDVSRKLFRQCFRWGIAVNPLMRSREQINGRAEFCNDRVA